MKLNRFATYIWTVLGVNLLVILWGAFVRASGSGAGCGSHWPLCNGEVVPQTQNIATLIEFSHRLTSGAAVILMLGLVVWAFRRYPRGHVIRWGAVFSLFFLFMEALIGAGLVLFEYVAANVSVARAFWMVGHLLNTFLLLGSLTLTAWWASGGRALRWRGHDATGWLVGMALVGVALLGADGGITALGDTLVLTAGVSPAESPIVALLVRLRVLHPILAFAVFALVVVAIWQLRRRVSDPAVRRFGNLAGALFVAQLLIGALNVALKAPIWIQLLHLLVADLIWITLVLMAAAALAWRTEAVEAAASNAIPSSTNEARTPA